MTAVLDSFNVEETACAIARAADTDSKGTGRPCRLQDASAVHAFLTALLKGCSLTAASMAGSSSSRQAATNASSPLPGGNGRLCFVPAAAPVPVSPRAPVPG